MKRTIILAATFLLCMGMQVQAQMPSEAQLAKWLKRFPAADTNKDGKLTRDEALAFRKQAKRSGGAPRSFDVNPGWLEERFPDHAVCYKTPEQMKAIFGSVTSFPQPTDGALRIVGTGHSFMAPGYRTLPAIAVAAGFQKQPLFTHTGGGMTGSARYKWEQENGIFQFDGKPEPKLLASIANAPWDAMMWGPYFNDKPEYYQCWMDFSLKYNPDMKFYLSDGWPQIEFITPEPQSESELTADDFRKVAKAKNEFYGKLVDQLNKQHPGKAFIMPTSDAMMLAVEHYFRDELPGVKGINSFLGREKLSLWRDRLGHLGPGFERLEGYVFYATLYGKSPELIKQPIQFVAARGEVKGYPSDELDQVFRKIAWQAVINNPHSGVKDENGDGIKDE